MGTIVIEVPGDFEYKIKVERWEDIAKELDKLNRIAKQKEGIVRLKKLAGSLPKDFQVSDEELHCQE